MPTAEQQVAWELTKALLSKMKSEANRVGSEFAVFYVPTSALIYDDAWEATQTLYGIGSKEWDLRQVEQDLARICREAGITFIPTTQSFREEAARLAAEGKDLYFKDEGHWNAEGHRFAAELLKNWLLGRFSE
jgi:hypothetical protein